MTFQFPKYKAPDFASAPLASSPPAQLRPAPADGIAPTGFHATSNYPEYVHLGAGRWVLARQSRMDCCLVLKETSLDVVEPRRLKKDDPIVVGRTENGEDGIFVHNTGFQTTPVAGVCPDKFSFKSRGTRETPFSRSYDDLYDLLKHDRDHGYITWVLGPAVAFDKDSRLAMQELIEAGYCHALLAGNALATHDLEAAVFGTGLGQDIYTQATHPLGHYNHLDVLNETRKLGSIQSYVDQKNVRDGMVWACLDRGVPMVLAGSIRDDGPLPGVFPDVYAAQNAMREHARKTTTCVALATQLHTIAFGNMLPGYHVDDHDAVRPVYFYIVDMSEFSTDKLTNRGSMQATAILTNVQDFIINLRRNLA